MELERQKPRILLTISDTARALLERLNSPMGVDGLASLLPQGSGQPFLVIPGFLEGDWVFRRTCKVLRACGYTPYLWQTHFNAGLDYNSDIGKGFERLHAISERHDGRKVTVIGHSLGGVLAGGLARFPQASSLINHAIKIASPDADISDPHAIAFPYRHLYAAANGARGVASESAIRQHMKKAAFVKETSVYSLTDGIIGPWVSALAASENNEVVNVGVGSHVGLPANPRVIAVMAHVLSRAGKPYRLFEPDDYPQLFNVGSQGIQGGALRPSASTEPVGDHLRA